GRADAAAGAVAELLPGVVRVPPGTVRGGRRRVQRVYRGGTRDRHGLGPGGRALLLQPRAGLRRPGPHRRGAARLRPGLAARPYSGPRRPGPRTAPQARRALAGRGRSASPTAPSHISVGE